MSDQRVPPDQDSPPQAAAARESDVNVVGARAPRRVVLRHDDTGSYQILMGNRLIQGFCQEFEEITGYSIGVNTQQQVHIRIEEIGRRRQAHYPDRGEDSPETQISEDQPILRAREEEVALFSTAHPGNPTIIMTWQDEAREHLVREITMMQNMIDLLARV